MTTTTNQPTLDERLRTFQDDYPEIRRAIELFNISHEHYQVSLNALQSTKTYVTSSTLLPGQHG
jgi:hypothetical protein